MDRRNIILMVVVDVPVDVEDRRESSVSQKDTKRAMCAWEHEQRIFFAPHATNDAEGRPRLGHKVDNLLASSSCGGSCPDAYNRHTPAGMIQCKRNETYRKIRWNNT